MKKISGLLLIVLVFSILLMTACDSGGVQDIIDNNTKTPLAVPTNLTVDESNAILRWNSVEYAIGYTVMANGTTYTVSTNSFSLQELKSGEYVISVMANGDGIMYTSSGYSDTISYTRITNTGNVYSDDVVAAFRSFDEINTKNSYLGYGIDVINASAIASKNILITYPIFDMDKLMDENLLKSNEHYNSFESIEASTIEEFSENMSTSTSITAGSSVSAKGNIFGVGVNTSASLSGGLTTSFTKTSDLVESQYFLEVIAENQSYWLILQTSEARYKELLSEEFRKDLYNPAVSAAQLFEKYGTHLLTSVAMGGNICMYYTMYSYDKNVSASQYAEVSRTLKANVEVAYGGNSVGAGSESSFDSAFSYSALAHSYGIQVDKKIVSAGGGSFGINNETTLYENYYDWQRSLDTSPVVIGIKDTNSLYPIWNLLDLSVEGAQARYEELYSYFQTYGAQSYDNLCRTYEITPSIAPTGIENIRVGTHKNYSENQQVNVTAGEVFRISFDVLPENATKYLKTFSVNDTSVATVDDTGLVTVSPTAPGGSYVRVTVTAGAVTKQITLYVINTYNVNFNTRVSGLDVSPIYGIMEGYTINEPSVSREGYILEGWYTDNSETKKFDFETDSVNKNLTLYAKWVAIKPKVTFETGDGSAVAMQTLAYKGKATKPKNPVCTGYTFDGWYTDTDHTEPFDFTAELTEDVTVYAKWTKIEYTVDFVTNGGTPLVSVVTSITEGYKIDSEAALTVKQYYEFCGWYKDAAFTKRFYFEEVTSDITLYAKWTPKQVTVKPVDSDGVSPLYDVLGSEIAARVTDVEHEFKITLPEAVKSGYTFVGWYLNGVLIDPAAYEFSPSENAYILAARWTVNEYTVTFDTDGGSKIAPVTADYGAIVSKPKDPTKVGYTFVGWSAEVPSTMPAESITLTALWTVNQYTVTFDTAGGSEIDPITADYGAVIVKPEDPTREGYTFTGWSRSIPDTVPAGDITLTAKWRLNTYTLTFKIDGKEPFSEIYGFGETIFYPEINVEGYTFSGWKYGLRELPATMPSKDIEVTGTLTVKNYTLSYYVDGGLYKRETYAYGAPIALIAEPKEDGKVFSGWTRTDGEIPSAMPASDIRIDGGFDQTIYYVSYYVDNVFVKKVPVVKGYSIPSYSPDAREGYSFSGWLVKQDEGFYDMPESMPSKDIHAYGSYTVNKYTVTFDTDGGSSVDAITADYGTVITKPADPTKEGYTFVGWSCEIPATVPAESITITALWTVNQYTVTFDTDGGSKVDAITADYGTDITKPADPTKEGYTFAGWSREIPATVPAESVTITALWTVNQYTVTFDTAGGSKIEAMTADHGTVITKPADPTRVGYTFAGWSREIPATIPAENITITALWTANKYTVTFNTDGGSKVNAITADYGTVITKPANPTKVGYTFADWSTEIPATMPAENVTVTAKWNVNQYTITFNTDGGSKVNAITADYGTAITKPAEPTKEGYTFTGWSAAVPTTMPAVNITLTAQWSLNTANITYDINSSVTVDGQTMKGDFLINQNYSVTELSYDVTQLNYAYAKEYNKYYTFIGWFTASSGGAQLTDSSAVLLPNVAGYTNADGKWISETTEVTVYAQWEQTEKEYMYIESAAELQAIEDTGKYLIICDIDFSGETWTPIKSFSGELNGDGHTITNILINQDNVQIGIFGTLSGSVENIAFKNITVSVSTNKKDVTVGIIAGVNNGTIRKCKVIKSSVTGETSYNVGTNSRLIISVGGIVGENTGVIEGCEASELTVYGYSNIGVSDGKVESDCGAIAGNNYGGEILTCAVSNSTVTAKVRGGKTWTFTRYCTYARVGGVCGYNSAQVKSCTEHDNVFSATYETTQGSYPDDYNKKGAIVGCNEGTVSSNSYSSLDNEIG